MLVVRAATYATAFIGFALVFLPARVLAWAGVARPVALGLPQATGILVGAAGAALALWCVFAFAMVGRGTPAPFDPPRRLVARGPYEWVRNPMYLGATLALGGAALFYRSIALLAYAGLFLAMAHVFVIGYEEPTLRRTFGADYDVYCRRVSRWWPRLRAHRAYTPGMSSIARMMREDRRARLRRMTPAERVAEALALGRSSAAMYASAHGIDPLEARGRLERSGQLGRRPSRVMQNLLE